MKLNLVCAANFTIEPLKESLLFWFSLLELPFTTQFAPYSQLFQQLLDNHSLLSENSQGVNLILIAAKELLNKTTSEIKELTVAIRDRANTTQAFYFVCLCPPSPEIISSPEGEIFWEKWLKLMEKELAIHNSVNLISYAEIETIYPVSNYYNPQGEILGDIPYTRDFYTALGTIIARKIQALYTNPYKVIVVDCDNTLWKGVCGEVGPNGVEIDFSCLALQEMLVKQYQAGMLICLCSKNNEEDVFAVFRQNPKMHLKLDHILSWRLNWQSKSASLRSLAEELNLGLDSFIFIDDSPLECAEVKANCVEVLTLQLPPSEIIPQFIKHIWALDHLKITLEDRNRTTLYRQNQQRESLKNTTLEDFLARLELRVKINPVEYAQIPRIAELTKRTNQFNLSSVRRTESEVLCLCESPHWHCLSVEVSDRFGDYGLVGAIFYQHQESSLIIETFLLSCRVLDRGVEHKIFAHLAGVAESLDLLYLELIYIPTPKNQPILNFLNSLGCVNTKTLPTEIIFCLPVKEILKLTYKPQARIKPNNISLTSNNFNASQKIDYWRIATELYEVKAIASAINSTLVRKPRPLLPNPYVPPATPLEKFLTEILETILSIDRIGIDDNIFALGCDSLQAALFLNQLGDTLKEIIYIVALTDAPTISQLSTYLQQNYQGALTKVFQNNSDSRLPFKSDQINIAKIQLFQQTLPQKKLNNQVTIKKNPRAIFILSAPRSGSTLLRVMLGGHPQLFVPPELHLLSFDNMAERKQKLEPFWSQGVIEAMAYLSGGDASKGRSILQFCEDEEISVKAFYELLQNKLGDKILVDKTPLYALDINTLKSAETYFDNPLYIHLARHPYGMINSFEAIKLDLVLRYQYDYSRRELGELIWLICQENILNFLQEIPLQRHYRITYEDLVKNPATTLNNLCKFCSIEFHQDMLKPYENTREKMTEGISGQGRMLGDLKFYQYQAIEAKNADKWKSTQDEDFLSHMTWEIAARLGYDEGLSNDSNYSPLVPLKITGEKLPFFCVHPISGSALAYRELVETMPCEQPFYGLQALGLNTEGQPLNNLTEIARRYLEAIKSIQPGGPYFLGGWSFGGLVAYEIAQQLLKAGDRPQLLFLIDTVPPSNFTHLDDNSLIKKFAHNLGRMVDKELLLTLADVTNLPLEEQLYWLWQQAKKLEVIPPDMSLRQWRKYWQVYQANFHSLKTYQPQTYDHKIILLRAEKEIPNQDATAGWSEIALGGLETIILPGDHYTIMKRTNLQILSQHLNFYLSDGQN